MKYCIYIMSERFNKLYSVLKTGFLDAKNKTFSVATVAVLTEQAMELVQTGTLWAGMRGNEKKELVVNVITQLVKDLIEDADVVGENFSEDAKAMVLLALDTVPFIIDATVNFAKLYKSGKKKCFSCCRS